MQSFESRRFRRSIATGLALTLLACLTDQIGLLSPLDNWFYDKRAALCQAFSKKPDERIEHVDIDDAAVDPGAVGRWPWSRRKVARIVEEIARAKPAAIGLDIYLTEPETEDGNTAATAPDDNHPSEPDSVLASALARQKNLVLMADLGVPSDEKKTPLQSAATGELVGNLELDEPSLSRLLRLQDNDTAGNYDLQDLFVRARRLAVQSRVKKALDAAPLTDDQLILQLLPHSDPSVQAPILGILRQEAAAYRARKSFRQFGFDVPPLKVPLIPTVFHSINLEIFSQSATCCGFVDYDFFNSPIVRSVPLAVEAEGRVYPQFGVAFACAILGADPRKAEVKDDRITIPTPTGPPLEIPTHQFHSQAFGRDFSAIADIPWFGGSDYQTMYDWPTHARSSRHTSVNVVWDICKATDKIQRNNREIDRAIQVMLGDAPNCQVDPTFAKRYRESLPAIDDSESRKVAVKTALTEIAQFKYIEQYAAIPASERTADENDQYEQLKASKSAMETLVQADNELQTQVTTLRANLSGRLAGKGVLVGWTAEGLSDHVNTSLHLRCPGVVIHGVIAESVLSNRWWRRAPDWVGITIVLFLGLVSTFLVSRLQPDQGFVAALLLAAVYLLLNGYVILDFAKWIVPVAGPVVTIGAVLSGCTLQRVLTEGFERNRVATEVAVINKEMDLARKVQAALIPKSAPMIPGLEAHGWTLAASVAGGDCYDLWTLPDGRLGILLADASGHGLAPAMVVSQVRTLVRALCDFESHPHGLLQRVNARVAEDLEPGRFITVFLGFLSPDGLLEYASAGHGPQFWYGCEGEEMQLLDSTGAPLGCDNEWLCDDPLPPIQIGTGCTLVVFSDGIFESMTTTGEQYGIDRLKELLHKTRNKSGKIIIEEVTAAMNTWQEQKPPGDDQTVVIARRIPIVS